MSDWFGFSVQLAEAGDRDAVLSELDDPDWMNFQTEHDGELVFTATGYNPSRVTERVVRVASHVRSVALIWEGEYVNVVGQYYEVDDGGTNRIDEFVSDAPAVFSYFAVEYGTHGPV